MNNLFNSKHKEEVLSRINMLDVQTKAAWGKMTVAQMLKHSTIPLKQALKNPKRARGFAAKLFAPLIKDAVIGHKPFKKNGYTPKEFKVETQEEFDLQKARLIELVKNFTPENVSDKNHPFFGLLSDCEWGESQFKHIDHHLVQFGV